jgi:hypothetical protein
VRLNNPSSCLKISITIHPCRPLPFPLYQRRYRTTTAFLPHHPYHTNSPVTRTPQKNRDFPSLLSQDCGSSRMIDVHVSIACCWDMVITAPARTPTKGKRDLTSQQTILNCTSSVIPASISIRVPSLSPSRACSHACSVKATVASCSTRLCSVRRRAARSVTLEMF